MKKHYEIVGRDGKRNGRAGRLELTAALEAYLDGSDTAAWSFALGLCRDADEAQELVQEACYRALKSASGYKAKKPVKSWLFTILRNAFVDSRRRMERRNGVSLDHPMAGLDPTLSGLAATEEPILESLERAETCAWVRRLLSRLSKKDRAILRLCVGERMTYDAVAKSLGIPSGTLRSRLCRARVKLRRAARLSGQG